MQKEQSPRRAGSLLCDPKEGSGRSALPQGGLRLPRPLSTWPCVDTDSLPFEDRPLGKLKESDRCSASENLYLDALSLDDEPDEPPPHRPERDFRSGLREVSLSSGHPWEGGWPWGRAPWHGGVAFACGNGKPGTGGFFTLFCAHVCLTRV